MIYYITRVLIALVAVLTITTVVYIVQDDREKKKQKMGEPVRTHGGRFWVKVYAAVTVLTLVVSAAVISILLKPNPYEVNSVYMSPTRTEFRYEASDEPQEAVLYQRAETTEEQMQALQDRLREASGMTGTFETNGSYVKLQYNQDCAILIDRTTLNWGVTFNDQALQLPNENLPGEIEAKQQANDALEQYGIDLNTVEYDSFTSDEESGSVVVRYEGITSDPAQGRYTGIVGVRLGQNGELIEITDNRIYCEAVKTVTCRSERDALQDTLTEGESEVEGTGYVDRAELGYYYNQESGYLIPTWKYEGQILCDDEEQTEYYWYPDICALQ